ncbi:fatty acid hydroxylase superfamily protein [Rhodobiaceae bacterium]|nr:fatty acid hydroxylase superfamily protein [Rhodobiaceae bacterium]
MTLEQLIATNFTVVTLAFYFSFILIEAFSIRFLKARGELNAKDNLTCIFMGLMSSVANGAAAFISVGAMYWAMQYQIISLPITITTVVICFIANDLRFYVHHRLAHRVRWPWAMHVVHHSSQHYNYSVALRQAWTKHFSGMLLLYVPLVIIGFNPAVILFVALVNSSYQFLLHTETIGKLPRWFEFIFNTPSHHRVHHANNPQYLDANYGGTLIIWDRLFGTFAEEDLEDRPVYGLVKNLDTFNPIKIAFHEYWGIVQDQLQKGLTLKDRALYLLAPPGWSHDGSRLTSEDIKREYYASRSETSSPSLAPAGD